MTHYEQECRRVCPEGCGKGLARCLHRCPTRYHYYHSDEGVVFKCKVTETESKFAERMAQEAERLREALQEISRKAVGPFDEYGSLARAALAATGEPATVK